MPPIDDAAVRAALATVEDPEIRRPITEIDMVKEVVIGPDGEVLVGVYLTVAGCPMRTEIIDRVTRAVSGVPGVTAVRVELDVMSEEQRTALKTKLRGGPTAEIPFSKPNSLTRVIAVASGKGGVGKSSVTVNLAVALAAQGRKVGLVDADIYGHSVPRMLGLTNPPTMVEGMIMPPQAHGVAAISMLPFKPGGVAQPVAFRGPMLHRSLEQFLADVWWGDLDILLLDLPPGTGDIAMSTAQLLPTAQLVVVTTPQTAAAEVAVRAGMLGKQTHQRVIGVIENMSSFPCPHCGEPIDLFGVGGGSLVAEKLSHELDTAVPLLGRVPFDTRLREGGDAGRPLVLDDPASPAAAALLAIADQVGARPRGLVGMSLGVTPAGRR
jgi:ATP-binding protein involved in chromosome partitioning